MTDNAGRRGRPWRRIRAQVLDGNPPCHICGKPGADTVDHIVPLSEGGNPLDPANLRPACVSCNSRRGQALAQARKRRQSVPAWQVAAQRARIEAEWNVRRRARW